MQKRQQNAKNRKNEIPQQEIKEEKERRKLKSKQIEKNTIRNMKDELKRGDNTEN